MFGRALGEVHGVGCSRWLRRGRCVVVTTADEDEHCRNRYDQGPHRFGLVHWSRSSHRAARNGRWNHIA